MMRRFSLLIFDLDNTLYDWYSAFLPAFYDMVDVAANILKCDRETLLDQLRQVHIKHHDVEHPFGLAETEIVQNLMHKDGVENVWTLLDPAFHSFNRRRKENLQLFPEVLGVLEVLLERNIRLVAYTDSKYYAAWGRVERLGLTNIFDTIYCREKSNSLSPYGRARDVPSPPPGKIVEIPSHETKPNPRILVDIVGAQGQLMSDVAYIGDSLTKDVMMARRAGCYAVWAKYGAHTDRAMYERLIRISHWTVEDIQRERNYAPEAKSVQPDLICERSLKELLPRIAGPRTVSERSRSANR